MRCKLILDEFGTNIQHIAWLDKILADMLNILKYASINQVVLITSRYQGLAKFLFTASVVQKTEECSPLYILISQREQHK